MPRRKKQRQHKLIGFKAYFDTDADILEWWEGIADGERSHVIRDVLREFLGVPARRKQIQVPGLHDMHRDIRWIQDALNDMPGYIERVIHHVAARQPAGTVPNQQTNQATRATPQEEENALNEDEKQRRDKRMRKATW
ncbi:MAG: hypothetical protein ACFE0Q_15400 [Anaerolineae bacterium]